MKQKVISLILLVLLLSPVLITCKSLERQDEPEVQVRVPNLNFPDIPVLPYFYFATPEAVAESEEPDEWVVPGSYLKALDIYFELIWKTEQLYLLDKDYYENRRNNNKKD